MGCKDIGIRKSRFVEDSIPLDKGFYLIHRVTHKTNFRDDCKGIHNVCFLILTIPCNLKFLSFFATTHYLNKKVLGRLYSLIHCCNPVILTQDKKDIKGMTCRADISTQVFILRKREYKMHKRECSVILRIIFTSGFVGFS